MGNVSGVGASSGIVCIVFFFSSRRRHTRFDCDWSSDVCSSDLLDGVRGDAAEGLLAVPGTAALRVAQARHQREQCAEGAFGLTHRQARHTADREIGRASCRGRGEISVVGVSLKKKKKNLSYVLR